MLSLLGWIGALIITIIIVAFVERLSRTNLPFGWLGNIIAGLIGGVLGQILMGQFGPFVFGVYLIPTFVGSFLFILAMRFVLGLLIKSRRR